MIPSHPATSWPGDCSTHNHFCYPLNRCGYFAENPGPICKTRAVLCRTNQVLLHDRERTCLMRPSRLQRSCGPEVGGAWAPRSSSWQACSALAAMAPWWPLRLAASIVGGLVLVRAVYPVPRLHARLAVVGIATGADRVLPAGPADARAAAPLADSATTFTTPMLAR